MRVTSIKTTQVFHGLSSGSIGLWALHINESYLHRYTAAPVHKSLPKYMRPK